ncbi:NnrT protein [Meridianimarinicoccus roseus]|uniref:NnrT protein n=1 Tax=Meridianimarinicoccus roseus TaxID=2072018 RepID=A0A2V2LIG3_9RHOB|nr:NnrT protein [Meridianimarinicoccus roseus]PWR03354.1 NnrT protein [Meridianimarinicoccus roseus]
MTRQGWSTEYIALALYPFGVGAAAVNVFFASLVLSWIDGPVASTAWSLGLGCLIGAPATWYFARHIRHLMDVADGREAS